ncbi:MAG: DUF547 domain-containing protein [Planctomycetota bacterium]
MDQQASSAKAEKVGVDSDSSDAQAVAAASVRERPAARTHAAAVSAAQASGSSARGLVGAVLIAMAVVASAVYALFQSGAVNSVAVNLFGPPKVVLAEAFEPDPDGPNFDHSAYDILLKKYVDPETGRVDYAGLSGDAAQLDAYIASLAEAPLEVMGRNHRLALLLNAYNACTLRLILDHWDSGTLQSIYDIPSELRWEDERWRIGEYTWSLEQIEHQEIRPNFKDTRIHWALVCAAVGCPPLRAEAYVPERLDEQLADQAERVHADEAFVRFNERKRELFLTSLYNWYGDDFEQVHGSVPAAVGQYLPAIAAEERVGRRVILRWLDYDWSLNAVEPAATQN